MRFGDEVQIKKFSGKVVESPWYSCRGFTEAVYDPAGFMYEDYAYEMPGRVVDSSVTEPFYWDVDATDGLHPAVYMPYSPEVWGRRFYHKDDSGVEEREFVGEELLDVSYADSLVGVAPFYDSVDMLSTVMDALRAVRKKNPPKVEGKTVDEVNRELARLAFLIAFARFAVQKYRKSTNVGKESLFEVKKELSDYGYFLEFYIKGYEHPLFSLPIFQDIYDENFLVNYAQWTFLFMYTQCAYSVSKSGIDRWFLENKEAFQKAFKEDTDPLPEDVKVETKL